MYSIGFPEMVKGTRTYIAVDHEATANNLKLAIMSNRKNSLFGDPYYGNNLLNIIFRQNNILLEDIIRDEVYTCIKMYVPQLQLNREDITLYMEDTKLYATIKALNLIDNTPDIYSIKLTELE